MSTPFYQGIFFIFQGFLMSGVCCVHALGFDLIIGSVALACLCSYWYVGMSSSYLWL